MEKFMIIYIRYVLSNSTRYLTWWMGRIENSLGNNGFAVGNKLSLGDVYLYANFAEVIIIIHAHLPFVVYVPFALLCSVSVLLCFFLNLFSFSFVSINAGFAQGGRQG